MAYTPVPAAVKAVIGTTIKVKEAATFVAIGGDIKTIQVPNPKFSKIDATHLLSAAKEWVAGIRDNGTLNIAINYVPNSAAHKTLLNVLGQTKEYEISFDITPAVKCTFSALASGFDSDAGGPEDLFSGTLTLDVSGAITWTP